MDSLVRKIIIVVFSLFVAITFLVFVIHNEMTSTHIIDISLILLVVALLVWFARRKQFEIHKSRLILLLIVGGSLIPRIIWVNLVHVVPKSDFYTIHTLAAALTQGELLYPIYISLFPHVFGYSKVLSIFYAIGGPSPFTAIYLNIALNVGILLLLYYLGSKFYNVKTGLIASAIYAFWPSQFLYNTLVLTEPFYTFGVLSIVCLYLLVIERARNKAVTVLAFCGLGIVAGLLKYIRPTALIVVLSIIIHYLFFMKNEPSKKNEPENNRKKFSAVWMRVGLSVILAFFYSLTSTIVLDGIEGKIGVEIARQSTGFNLFVGMNGASKGKWSAEDSALLQPMIDQGMSAAEIHDAFFDMGMDRIKNRGFLAHLQHQLNKNYVMWGSDSESLGYTQLSFSETSHIELSRHIGWLSHITNIYYFIFLLLAFLSIILLKEQLSVHSLILHLYILGTVAVHMLVEVHGRYHYPAIPLICVLAAATLGQNEIKRQ